MPIPETHVQLVKGPCLCRVVVQDHALRSPHPWRGHRPTRPLPPPPSQIQISLPKPSSNPPQTLPKSSPAAKPAAAPKEAKAKPAKEAKAPAPAAAPTAAGSDDDALFGKVLIKVRLCV